MSFGGILQRLQNKTISWWNSKAEFDPDQPYRDNWFYDYSVINNVDRGIKEVIPYYFAKIGEIISSNRFMPVIITIILLILVYFCFGFLVPLYNLLMTILTFTVNVLNFAFNMVSKILFRSTGLNRPFNRYGRGHFY